MSTTAMDRPERDIAGINLSSRGALGVVVATLLIATAAIDYTETEWAGVWSAATLAGGIFLLYWVANVNPLQYMRQKWKTVLAYFLIYAALAVPYALVRWEFKHQKWNSAYDRLCREFTSTKNVSMVGGDTCVNTANIEEWKKVYDQHTKKTDRRLGPKPKAWDNLTLIQRWMMLWPTDMVVWGLTSFVPQMWDTIVNYSMGLFEWVSARHTKGVK